MLVLYTQNGVLNKILKCIFSPTNIISTYLLKTPKATKWDQQKNKSIKCSHMEKKKEIKLAKKNKTLISPTLILAFQMAFFHWSIHGKKKPYLYYSKCYFINLTLQNSIFPLRCSNNLKENKSKQVIKLISQ
jgi:hypothetical protein